MTAIAVNHHGKAFGTAVPNQITRHCHPKARPETVDAPVAPTGIDYLNLVADAHHARAGAAIRLPRTGHRARPGPRAAAATRHAGDPNLDGRCERRQRRHSRRGWPFLDPGRPCRRVGGVNVEHAQRSEHERR